MKSKDLIAKEREVALQQEEELFRSIVDSIKDYAIFMLDKEGKVMTWNIGAAIIKGYKEYEIKGSHFSVFYTNEEIEKNKPELHLRLALAEGKYETEGWRVRKNGSFFWANVIITALYNSEGQLRGFTKIVRDITKKRASEERISYHARLLEDTSDVVLSTNLFYEVRSWNPAAEKLYGYRAEETIGRDLADVVQLQLGLAEREAIRKELNTSGYWKQEVTHLRKDGSPLMVQVSVSVTRNEKSEADGFVFVCRDFTERRRMEEQLQEFNEELERKVQLKATEVTNVLERITDAFLALDKNFCCTYVNKRMATIMGREPGSLIGKCIWEEYPDLVGSPTYQTALKAMQEQIYLTNVDHYLQIGFWHENHMFPSPDGLSVFIRDISEMKKSEEALRISEYRYRTLFDEGVAGILVLDASDLRILEANNTIAVMLGFSKEEFPGMHFYDLLCEGPLKNHAMQVASGSMDWSIHAESLVKRKDKNCLYVEAISRILPDGNHLVFLADIAERKRIEKEILGLNERFNLVSKATNDGVWDLDLKKNTLWWNDSHFNMIGVDPAEFKPTREEWEKRIHPDDRENAIHRFDDAIQKGKKFIVDEFRVKRGDGSYGVYYDRSYVIYDKDNNPLRIIGAMTDITELKKVEEQVRVSERKYKLLFHSNPMPMWMLSISDQQIIDVNESALRHYGYSREEFLSLTPESMRPSEEVERYRTELRTEIPGQPKRGIWQHKKKDGSLIFVEIHAYDVLYEDKPVRLVLSHDVTEKLHAEEELVKSLEEVKRLASYLQDVREEEKKNIAREIHDELGQMLTGLKMDIVWLRKKIASEDHLILHRFERTLALLSDTKQTIRRISTDLHPAVLKDLGLVAALEGQSRDFESRSGIRVQFVPMINEGLEMDFSPATAIGLYRVFQESLNNVAKHAHARNVNVFLEVSENKIVFRISDDGIGFNVAEAAGKKTLGLVGIRERALMLNGEYNISSLPGEGTTIVLTVPLI